MIRAAVRTTVELLGTATGVSAGARRSARDSVAILAYHNVVSAADAGRGDSSLHLPLDRFIRQIDHVSRTHEIVDIEALGSSAKHDRPRAIITFDDAYQGAVTLALPELVRRGVPAVVFVAPGLLGAASTWWDEMAEVGLLSDTLRDDALHSLAGRNSAIRHSVLPDGDAPVLPDSFRIASIDELHEHAADGIRIGSHTWSHEYLPALEPLELKANLARTLHWLETWSGATTRWLALPYGGGDANVGRAAIDAGHSGVLRISGGMWHPAEDRSQVPRINVPAGISLRGLELRTSGLFRA